MPDPTLRPQAPALWAGRYRLGTCIGRGSSGKVFAAEDVREGRQVAVKILQPLDPVERGRLQREIAALSFLQLPGVVRLLDHGQVGAQVYLVMELVSGAPFPGPGRHTWEQLRGPVMSLLGTLAQLHTRGFVHRDLKPDNLRLCANGEVVVLDFGLVRRPARDPGLTEGAAGTPRYLPPEQITGGNLDGRSDIYALGVMLYEALTGVDPWEGLELEQRLAARLYQASPKMPADPSLPPGLTRLIDRMLSRDWLLRPSAAELLAELEEGQGDSIDSYTEEIVQDVLRRVAAGERIAIWGPAAARPERLLHRINHLRPEAVLLPPGGRPYTSLLLAFADAQRDEDPTEALSVVLRHCPLLLIPDWEGLDRQSRSLVERIAGPQVCIQAHPTAIRLQPLPHDVLMQYFEGPDLLLHLREDAATELLRRTDGWPAAVQTVLGEWRRQGIIHGRLIRRDILDRLAAERVVPPLPPAGELPEAERQVLGTLLLCWPDTRVAEVQAATGLRGWELGLLLEDMEEAGLVRRTELGWQPLRQAALRGGSAARLAVHRVMATLLAPGHASRFWHLLWCGSPEEVAEEALCRATVLEEEGKLGEVRQVLEEALRQCSENRLLQRRALCVRVDQDRPEVLVGAESLVRGDPEAGRMLELTRLARGGKADTPLPMEGEQPSIDPALWGRTAAARFQALASIYGPEQLLQREAALLEELQGQVPEAPDAQGRLEGWRGLHEFRKGEYKKAAAAHQKAAEYRRGIGRLAARDNAARALLFAGEVEEAERVAATLQEEARALRHPSMEAQALWLQRFAYNIRGGRSPWPVWLAAMAEVGSAARLGLACLTEAFIATRGGDAAAVELCLRAIQNLKMLPEAQLHARALAVYLGQSDPGPWPLEQCRDPAVRWEVATLLQQGGIVLDIEHKELPANRLNYYENYCIGLWRYRQALS